MRVCLYTREVLRLFINFVFTISRVPLYHPQGFDIGFSASGLTGELLPARWTGRGWLGSIVRFDLRPFGSDTPSQPRSGVYVKEPVFAIAWITLAKIIHKLLISNLLSDSEKMYYSCYPLYGHKKRTVLNRPFFL